MSTPGRRSRSRRTTPDAPGAPGPSDARSSRAPSLAPSAAGSDIGRVPMTPRRSARIAAQDDLPTVITNRGNTGYGTEGRSVTPSGVQTAQDVEDTLDNIRGESASTRPGGTTIGITMLGESASTQPGGTNIGTTIRPVKQVTRNPGPAASIRPAQRLPVIHGLDTIQEISSPLAPRNPVPVRETGPAFVEKDQVPRPTPAAPSSADANTTSVMAERPENGTGFEETEQLASEADSADSTLISRVRTFLHLIWDVVLTLYGTLLGLTAAQRIFLATLVLLGSLVWQAALIPSPTEAPPTIRLSDPVSFFKHYTDTAWTSVASWATGQPVSGLYKYPWALEGRVKHMEQQVASLDTARGFHADTIKHLQDVLPDMVVTRVKDGIVQFPSGMFDALKERFDALYSEKDHVPTWDAFMRLNSFKLREMIESTADASLRNATETHRVLSADEVINLMEKQARSMSSDVYNRVSAELDERWTNFEWSDKPSNTEIIKAAIDQALDKYFTAHNRILYNQEWAMHSINYLSPHLGAIVDPSLSSPTKKRTLTRTQSLYTRVMGMRTANPHIAALEDWTEVGDCWCAAPPDNDRSKDLEPDPFWPHVPTYLPKAQLTVLLPEPIQPTSFTIEHFPFGGTLDPKAAPKMVELWVQIKNETTRNQVQERSLQVWPTDVKKINEGRRRSLNKEGVFLPADFVLVATAEYDMMNSNYVQNFPIPLLEDVDVAVDKVSFRAVTNYGKKHTCFYQLKLHGDSVREHTCRLLGEEESCPHSKAHVVF